jgi:hypothetical protein
MTDKEFVKEIIARLMLGDKVSLEQLEHLQDLALAGISEPDPDAVEVRIAATICFDGTVEACPVDLRTEKSARERVWWDHEDTTHRGMITARLPRVRVPGVEGVVSQ